MASTSCFVETNFFLTSQVESLNQVKFANKLGDITAVLQMTPELNNYPVSLWEKTYEFLKSEGFRTEKFMYMIEQNPKLLITPQEKIFNSINNWRSFQFGERDTIKLLERFPELLFIEHTTELTSKLSTLKTFVGGGTNLYKLLLNSPSVFGQRRYVIEEKVKYFRDVMKVDPVEVYKSDALASDILTIKTRHIFLERLGLYIVKKQKEPNEISKNPKVYQIYDTSDKRFATKVCHVTLGEYETFQQLYKKEIEGSQENRSDDEEDDVDENSA